MIERGAHVGRGSRQFIQGKVVGKKEEDKVNEDKEFKEEFEKEKRTDGGWGGVKKELYKGAVQGEHK